MTTTAGELGVERRGPVLWLTPQREERRNAMSHAVLEAMAAATLIARVNGACMAGGMGLLAMCGHAAFQQKRKPEWKGR